MLERTLKNQKKRLEKIKKEIARIVEIQKNGKVLKNELSEFIQDIQKKTGKKWLSKPLHSIESHYDSDSGDIDDEWDDDQVLEAVLIIPAVSNLHRSKLEVRLNTWLSARAFMKKSFPEKTDAKTTQAFLISGYTVPLFTFTQNKNIMVCLGNQYRKIHFTKKEINTFFEYGKLKEGIIDSPKKSKTSLL